MKTISLITLAMIVLLGTAHSQPGVEYPGTVFAYGKEITPSHWEGIGSDELYLVDTNGERHLYHPRNTGGQIRKAQVDSLINANNGAMSIPDSLIVILEGKAEPARIKKNMEQVHRELIEKFERLHENKRTIWFGTNYFIYKHATAEEVHNFRDAASTIRAGGELSNQMKQTPAAYSRVRYDIKKHGN